MDDTFDLVGTAEVAERLGVSPQAVSNWRKRHPLFPRPAADLKMGPIWHWQDICDWAESRRKDDSND